MANVATLALAFEGANTNRPNLVCMNPDTDAVFKELEREAASEIEVSAKLNKCWSKYKATVIILTSISAWVLGGAAFYAVFYEWPYTSAMFYAVQAGLSIGYGDDAGHFVEFDDASLLFTILYVMAGSSFIVGALGLFVSLLVEHQNSVIEEKKKDMRDNPGKYKRLAKEEKSSCRSSINTLCLKNTNLMKSIAALLVWLAVGTIFGMAQEDWSFIRALYFSVTGLSTAGLQAPTIPSDQENWQMVFLALYCLTGVPVYAMCLGQFAGVIINKHTDQMVSTDIYRALDMAEFQYAAKLAGDDGIARVNFHEFMLFKLLRLGIIDNGFIDKIKLQFSQLDVNEDNDITANEMNAALTFADYDADGSGFIERNEFVKLARHMKLTPSKEEINKLFSKVSSSGTLTKLDGNIHSRQQSFTLGKGLDTDHCIDRTEFCRWYIGVKEAEMERARNTYQNVSHFSSANSKTGDEVIVLELTEVELDGDQSRPRDEMQGSEPCMTPSSTSEQKTMRAGGYKSNSKSRSRVSLPGSTTPEPTHDLNKQISISGSSDDNENGDGNHLITPTNEPNRYKGVKRSSKIAFERQATNTRNTGRSRSVNSKTQKKQKQKKTKNKTRPRKSKVQERM